MKTKIWVMLAVMGVAALPTLATIDVAVDRAGGGAADIVVSSLDWNVGNGLGIGAANPTVGTNFEVRVQNSLSVFNLAGGGTAQPAAGREWTLVGQLPETVLAVNGALPFQTVVFGLNAGAAPNTIRIYESAANASDLAGTGFNDGTLILEATATSLQSTFTGTGGGAGTDLDQFLGGSAPVDDYPTIDTITGIGVTNLTATVNFADPNYFTDFASIAGTIRLTLFNTSQITPFAMAEPSALFLGYAPNLGTINGVNGTDFQFQLDANQSFDRQQAIPEPVTAGLGLMGLTGLALAALRRRAA